MQKQAVLVNRFRVLAGALVLGVAVMGAGCGGGTPVNPDPDGGGGSISGLVVKGRVAGATVTAYGLDAAGRRKVTLGASSTDEDGAFRVVLPSYNGPLLLVAAGGAYPEEAVAGATVRLESGELTYLASDYQSSTAMTGVAITPVSHLAAGLALRWVEAEGKPVGLAGDEAWTHLNNHFGALVGGGLDWRRVAPADFTVPGSGQLDGAGRAGLILAGLSMQARGVAEKAGLTPGAGVTSLSLVQAIHEDLRADGYFDGFGASGALVLPSGGFVSDAGPTASPLDGSTVRDGLARAIERFIEGARNATSATVNDALPLLNQLSVNADARIFRTGGVAYDHSGPALTLDVRWRRADGVQREPVLPGELVGGTLVVSITATDDSTILGLSLTANGAPVTVLTMGSGGALQGTAEVATGADGPVTLVVSSPDVHGNTSEATRHLVVDNTPPAITVAPEMPSTSAHYSTIVPVNVVAADTSGVKSFTQSGLAGFVNQSGATAQLSGTWTVPPSQPDGVLPVTLVATDAVGNVSTLVLPVHIDRTAPVLALEEQLPPRYTSAAGLTLHLAASDAGSGVGQVLASIDGGPSIPATAALNGGWEVAVPLGAEGNHLIRVWGVDSAVPVPNSSFNQSLLVQVTRDTSPPAPAAVSVPSYFDERPGVRAPTPISGMELELDATGNPLVPAVVKFPPGASKVGVVGATSIYKASTRLSWGPTPPTAAQLYAQDGINLNVPFLVFDVPVTATEAPLRPVAAFTIRCTNGCGGAADFSGELIADPNFTSNPRRWLLPLSLETIPQLAQLGAGSAELKASIFVTDEAGNVSTLRVDLPFHVIAPPLIWVEDTAYPAAADPRSIFGYRRTGVAVANYEQAFNAANPRLVAGQLRMVRYVIRNASAAPVAISIAPSATAYQQMERWDDVTDSLGTSNSIRYTRCFSAWTGPSFCAASPSAFKYQDYFPAADCSNIPGIVPPTGTVLGMESAVALAPLGSAGFLAPQPGGNESTPATAVGGAFVIPAASGGVPGKLALYLTRPAAVPRSVTLTKRDAMYGGPSSLGPNAYSFPIEDFWTYSSRENCTTADGSTVFGGADVYTARRHARFLASARTMYSALVNLSAAPLDTSGTTLGETTPVAVGYAATVAYTH